MLPGASPPRQVVMTTTPFPPRTPYMAMALASFRTSMQRMSDGLSQSSPRPGVTSTGMLSTTYNGSGLPLNVLAAKTRTEIPPPGERITRTPVTRPSRDSSIWVPDCVESRSPSTEQRGTSVSGAPGAP
jgi:hypothetical protein